jgi:HNH endonuclease
MPKFEITWLEDKSDEGLLEEIRRVASLFPGRRLTRQTFSLHAKIKSGAVERRFGSWSEATRRAGLDDAMPIYGEAAICDDLRRVAMLSEDESLTQDVYSEKGRYSVSHITRRFGGWREALEKAGIGERYVGPPVTPRMRRSPNRGLTEEEILDRIRAVSTRLHKPILSGQDIVANSDLTYSQLNRRFGSVTVALKRAGIEQDRHGRRHTEDEVFENLLAVWTHYGRPPTWSEMDRPPSTVGSGSYIHRWGRWRTALRVFVERANSEPRTLPMSLLDRHFPKQGLASRR